MKSTRSSPTGVRLGYLVTMALLVAAYGPPAGPGLEVLPKHFMLHPGEQIHYQVLERAENRDLRAVDYEFAVKWLKGFRTSSDAVCALYADDFLFEDPMLDQHGITDKGDLHRLFDVYANKDPTNGVGVHKDVADSLVVFDEGNFGALRHGANQALTAAGQAKVHVLR